MSQQSLTEIEYPSTVTQTQPDEGRQIASIDTSEDLYNCEEGDLLWIDGTEYVVVTRSFGFFHKPLYVVGEDGTQGVLVGGALSSSSSTGGVAWACSVSDTEHPSRSDLLCTFDRVVKYGTETYGPLHAWLPDSNTRDCPACDAQRPGEPLRIETRGRAITEIRHCTNTECHHLYRFIRTHPLHDDQTYEARLRTRDTNGGTGSTTIRGVFEAEERDTFKIPVETTNGRQDGIWTATEVAAFLNPKMDGDDPFGYVSVSDQRWRPGSQITWKDSPGYNGMTVTFRKVKHPSYTDFTDSLAAFPATQFPTCESPHPM